MAKFYKRVEIDADGRSAEPVNFVGVHPLKWDIEWDKDYHFTIPDAGFVEVEAYEKEFVKWYSGMEIEKIERAYQKWINEIKDK